ncbi:MAG: hypothetical protein LBL59_08735 [Xanthomonadaceae bacterium]|nr:hypothetical protein [Xanthomonadaceae bacterium]
MQPRSLCKLIRDCHSELDDDVGKTLYKDSELADFLNEAVEEACIRARLLVESTAPDICRIPLRAGVGEYRLHPSVVVIRRAILKDSRAHSLKRTTSAVLDRHRHDWREHSGHPRYLVRDQQARQIDITPVPDMDSELHLTVWRVPTEEEVMELPDDEPVIDAIHHRKLVNWACFRAYSKKDSEKEDLVRADRHLVLFEQYFGPRPTARELQQLAIDPVTGTKPYWF